MYAVVTHVSLQTSAHAAHAALLPAGSADALLRAPRYLTAVRPGAALAWVGGRRSEPTAAGRQPRHWLGAHARRCHHGGTCTRLGAQHTALALETSYLTLCWLTASARPDDGLKTSTCNHLSHACLAA